MTDEPAPLDLGQVKSWRIDIANHVEPTALGQLDVPIAPITFQATFSLDEESYAMLAEPEATYTVQYTEDLNPWHRSATGWRARLRRLRDGVWWTFQRRVLRRSLVETVTVTVPNCRAAEPRDQAQ